MARVWDVRVYGSSMFQLRKNFKILKVDLRKFNKEHFSRLPTQVKLAKHEIEVVQRRIQEQPLKTQDFFFG